MSILWSSCVTRGDGQYVAQDFQRASYQLICQQVLYASNPKQRTSYRMIERFKVDFERVMSAVGLSLHQDTDGACYYVIPVVEPLRTLGTEETIFVLCLRQMYDEKMREGDLVDDGSGAVVSLIEIQECAQRLFARDLQLKGKHWKELSEAAKRYGLVRVIPNDPGNNQPFDLLILPGIVPLLSRELVSQRAAAWQAVGGDNRSQIPDQPDPGTTTIDQDAAS